MNLRNRFILATGLAILGIGGGLRAEDTPLVPLQQIVQGTKDLLPPPPGMTTNHPTWQSSASVGLAMTRGNKDTLLVNAKLLTERKTTWNEWALGMDGAYGEDNSVKNYEMIHGFGQADHFFTHRLFVFGRLDGLHDGIKSIDYRFTGSPGLGYYLLRETNVTLAAEAGPSVIVERQGTASDEYAALRLAERFEYKLSPTTKLWQTAEFIPEVDKLDNYIVNAEVGIDAAIAKNLSLQVYLQDNFVNQPAPGFQNNDLRLISGVSYKF